LGICGFAKASSLEIANPPISTFAKGSQITKFVHKIFLQYAELRVFAGQRRGLMRGMVIKNAKYRR